MITILIAEIQRSAETGIYEIRGGGSKGKLPNFDDLVFLVPQPLDILWKAIGEMLYKQLVIGNQDMLKIQLPT